MTPGEFQETGQGEVLEKRTLPFAEEATDVSPFSMPSVKPSGPK